MREITSPRPEAPRPGRPRNRRPARTRRRTRESSTPATPRRRNPDDRVRNRQAPPVREPAPLVPGALRNAARHPPRPAHGQLHRALRRGKQPPADRRGAGKGLILRRSRRVERIQDLAVGDRSLRTADEAVELALERLQVGDLAFDRLELRLSDASPLRHMIDRDRRTGRARCGSGRAKIPGRARGGRSRAAAPRRCHSCDNCPPCATARGAGRSFHNSGSSPRRPRFAWPVRRSRLPTTFRLTL